MTNRRETKNAGLVPAIGLAIAASLIGPSPTNVSADPNTVQPVTDAGRIPLFTNLGTLHFTITTSIPLAQQYFDQGLRLVFAFNHEEAINSFKEATKLDSRAAMPYWGIALALGPNINLPMGESQGKQAFQAIQSALQLMGQASPKEQAYIRALATRYSDSPDGSRAELDAAYAVAMKTLWQEHPQDATAGTLYAEALMNLQPWDYWTIEGHPKGHAEEIVKTLEQAMAVNPDHPGACHYYIHAVESSFRPERALPCAERLAEIAPGAGHLVHMPAHIYLRLGLYDKAAEHNVHAVAVDREYLSHRSLSGIYPTGYYPHNVHFLWAALTMQGRSREALEAARDLKKLVSWEQARHEPALEEFTPTLTFALVRFGKWEELLIQLKPPPELVYTMVIWHYGRGVALAAEKRFDEARQEHQKLVGAVRRLPENRTVGVVPVVQLAKIAERVVAGEIAAREGRLDDAVKALEEATVLEDAVRYYEPPLWHIPVRHSLGAVLLEAGHAEDSERIYRQDLKQHPNNGWALFGLEESLKAQNRDAEAAGVHKKFEEAWRRADITLVASRF